MKSKISFFNKAVFKRNMTGGIALWAGFVLTYIVLMPLVLYNTLNGGQWIQELTGNARVQTVEHAIMRHLWSQSIYVPMCAAAAIITAMYVFSYLFTARNSNMMHTYPVDRAGMFCTNYISGMIYLFVPQFIASLLELMVGISFGGGTALVIKSWFLWIGVMFIEDLFFFSMSVCVLMFVGNIIAVPVLYLILNFLYRGMLVIFEAMVYAACYGVNSITGDIAVIGALTPIMYMARMIGIKITGDQDSYIYKMWGEKALLGYFAAAVLLTIIAWATYQKKHIETAGDVITVEWMKPIFRWGVAVCTSALGAVFFGSMFMSRTFTPVVVFGLAAGIVGFFIAQMLIERSFRVFNSKRIREGIIFAAVMCVCYTALDADILGYEKVIPSEDEINGIMVYAQGMNMYAVSEDEISWVRDIHKQIIDSKKEFESCMETDGTYSNISLSYMRKDGSCLRRSYSIPDLPDKESVSEQIAACARKPETILKGFFGIHYPDIEVYGGRIEWHDMGGYEAVENEVRLSETDAKKLYEAAVKDAEEGHFYFEDDTAETISGFGNLTLDVRDEQGFISVNDGAAGFYGEGSEKDGYAEIWLNSSYTHLIETLDELGYLSDGLRDMLEKNKQ